MRMYLGPFELHEPAGNGAMGEVWRATHRAQGLPVAVKVAVAPEGGESRPAAGVHQRTAACIESSTQTEATA